LKSKCSDCYYSFEANAFDGGAPIWACDYIEFEHKRRPCPYGDGCTVFKPRKPGHRDYTSKWFEGKNND
jgi:hypothetical protein